MKYSLVVLVLAFCLADNVCGHGYLIKPPGRNALWRVDRRSPAQHTDNELNCGGYTTQHNGNGGRCGACGDSASNRSPLYANNGKYANGIIAATYTQGQYIDVEVRITANHMGSFVFRVENSDSALPQMERGNGLPLASGRQYFSLPGGKNGLFKMRVKLPNGLVCNHCVFRWWWRCGNNWGCDSMSGQQKCGKGYGKQETFVNCADIRILPTNGKLPPTQTIIKTKGVVAVTKRPIITPRPVTMKPAGKGKNCVGAGYYKNSPRIAIWCSQNCPGYCPASHCKCT